MSALAALRQRLPSHDGSTINGIAAALGAVVGCLAVIVAAVLCHIITPDEAHGPFLLLVGFFTTCATGGAAAIVIPQHAAPPPPATEADKAAEPPRDPWERLAHLLPPPAEPATPGDTMPNAMKSAAFSFASVGAAETEAIALIKTVLPELKALVPAVETMAGASASVEAETAAVLANADAAVSALSASSPVTDVNTAILALTAVVGLLPAAYRTVGTILLSLAQSAYVMLARQAPAPTPAAPAAA